MSWVWDEEKIRVPDRIRTYNPQTPDGCSIHLSYGELMESDAIYYVQKL